jgi:uncharacterized protein DUF4232
MTRTGLARSVLIGAAVMAGVAGLAGCGAGAPGSAAHLAVGPVATTSGGRHVVPWVDRPGTMFVPSPIPTRPPKTDARPCTAADIRVRPDGGNGGGGHQYSTFAFRNISSSSCLLKGFPRVVASEPGRQDVVASDGGFFVGHFEVTADMAPGQVTYLSIETETDCTARYTTPNTWPTLIYHTVTVDIPGGGDVQLHFAGTSLDVLCGLFTGRFDGPHPATRYTSSPIAHATAALELPSTVRAGTMLDYVVHLTNPTSRTMTLDPCPAYTQGVGSAGKEILALNCDVVRRWLPHQTVRYAMQIPVPATTPTGPAEVHWNSADVLSADATGTVEVRGADTPCVASQLSGAITGPGTVPGPPNLLGMKGLATEVPLTVTNHSDTACSVLGSPLVAISSAAGNNLGLIQANEPVIAYNSDPTATPVILAAHGGSARATLYWNLPWCAADPNPVTVTINLPANGATVAITPTGGWQPSPCRRDQPATPPGSVSSSVFRPA